MTMKRYKEAVDAIRADDALREAIAALPREGHKPQKTGRRIGLIAAVLAVVIAVGAVSIPLFSLSMNKSADMADYETANSYSRQSQSAAWDVAGDYDSSGADEGAYAYATEELPDEKYAFTGTETTATAAVSLPANRKLIRDAQLSAETKEYDKFLAGLDRKLAALKGYVASSDSSTGYDGTRYATLVLRVPAASLDAFLTHIGDTATVTNQSTSVQDVTDDYIDVESRITALKTEQETLLELLKKAENLTDTLEIQDRLSEVRARLESYKGRLKALDDQIDYSTVTLDLREVERETTPEGKTFFEQVRANLSDNLYSIGRGFRSFALVFLSGLPYIFLWLCGIGVIILIVVLIIRRRRKKMK